MRKKHYLFLLLKYQPSAFAKRLQAVPVGNIREYRP